MGAGRKRTKVILGLVVVSLVIGYDRTRKSLLICYLIASNSVIVFLFVHVYHLLQGRLAFLSQRPF